MRNRLFRAVLQCGDVYRQMLAVFLSLIGPRAAYRITEKLARFLYQSLEPVRVRAEGQCRAALGRQVSAEDLPRLAEQSFVHRVWNLTDLMLARRYLHSNTFHHYGGRIPEPHLQMLHRAQQDHLPIILVTAYYGPYDLLPVFLGYNGIRVGAVYRPHPNSNFDAFREEVRSRSGCEMIPVDHAIYRVPQILESGGMVAIVADHHADRRGLPVTFLGLPTRAIRSVGILADRYGAGVAVAGIRRRECEFRFEIVVSDVFDPQDWQTVADPVEYITHRYLRGLEQIILRDPSQYLWAHPRWGEEFVRLLAAAEQGEKVMNLTGLEGCLGNRQAQTEGRPSDVQA